MKNMDIRRFAKSCGVTFWMIAADMGISEPTLTRRLRNELVPEEKAKYRTIIKRLEVKI